MYSAELRLNLQGYARRCTLWVRRGSPWRHPEVGKRVSATTPPMNLLDELEARQDEVLRQLDELNQRLEQTLAEYGGLRKAEPASPTGNTPATNASTSNAPARPLRAAA